MSEQNSDANTEETTEQNSENGTEMNSNNGQDAQSAPEQGEAEAGNDSELSLEEALGKLQAAEQEAERARDDLLRVQAEMQNLRRRSEQDVEKAHKYGQEKFAGELLSVIDNLERALDAATDHDDERVRAIYDGVDLTLKSFKDLFDKFNIQTIDPLGEPFDPLEHQAMSTQENGEVEPNTVTAVMQKGYKLHERVIRPAMVMVSKAPAGS